MNDKDIERSNLIDQYLSGHLTDKEMARFKKQLEEDAALRTELENYEISREVIRNYGLRNDLKRIRKNMLQEQIAETPSSPKARVVSIQRYWARVAATVLILLVGFLAIQLAALSGENLYEEKAFPYEVTVSRNGEATLDSQNQIIQQRYASGNFEEATRLYESLSAPSVTATFIAGNAYLQLDQPQKAKTAFQRVLDVNARQGTDLFEEDAEYYLALSYLRSGEYDQAFNKFKKIKASGSDYSQYIGSYFLWKLRMLDWKAE